ncbi:MAG: CRISPR-associated helicase Cas3' [bacterium]
MNKPKSHPDKLLIDHLRGILSQSNVSDMLLIANSFHDIGKIGINFQKKISGKSFEGYSHHAYISTYYLINGFVNNKETLIKRFPFINDDNFEIILLICANIIIGHHGYLRNISEIFSNDDEWNNMISFLKQNDMTNQVNDFFKENNLLDCNLKFTNDFENCEFYRSYGRILGNIEIWEQNALQYYFMTITTYAELVNGDRKDASKNKLNYRKKNIKKYGYSLQNNLEWLLNKFSLNVNANNDLNKKRNEIRILAVNELKKLLNDDNNRVFTLTAPTGAGKTLMMLALAIIILEHTDFTCDIIYALPFLSIIDQTIKILNNDLRIETLNYTSASDTSNKLQQMMSENASKDMIDYAYSENSFDHPFVLTTFNQLFETLLSNSTSKILKLKNFRKRIFLIDEFQAANPSQYYVLVNILNEFCRKYDSYAIISTATMPNFNINLNDVNNDKLKKLFKKQFKPKELLPKKIFDYDVFNRYKLNFEGEVDSNMLFDMVNTSTQSTLLILNTIRTSQLMLGLFHQKKNFENIYLLNGYESTKNRVEQIKLINNDLNNGVKILVISTQVIEAGVDISFPVEYRDAAPPSSVVQGAGRCNRNGEFGMGQVHLFLYKDENNLYDCNKVYQGMMPKNFKDDIKNKIPPVYEREFHDRCNKYFIGLSLRPEQGKVNENQNIVEDILNGDFSNIGKYRFIQGNPNTYTVYVSGSDDLWYEYVKLYNELKTTTGFAKREEVNIKFKKIRGEVLTNTINVKQKDFDELNTVKEDIFGVYKLIDKSKYDERYGLIM